jgi:hypothetical protein
MSSVLLLPNLQRRTRLSTEGVYGEQVNGYELAQIGKPRAAAAGARNEWVH